MSQQIPEFLRLHVEEPAALAPPPCVSFDAVDRLCQSFRSATGWSLQQAAGPAPLDSPEVLWARTLSPQADEPSHLAIHRTPGKTADDLQNELLPLCDLVDSIADLVGKFHQTQQALVRREAELAAGIPVVATPDDPQHVAQRLQAVLRGGVEAVDAQAAALYMLDDATNELKLRAAWGVSQGRLLDAPRPLRGAVADLEALTGHAVVIEDVALLPHWKVPMPLASALCVPVSSATTPLGTLWIFGDQVRDFSEQQTNIIEIIAGRIAAELERQVLLAAVSEQRESKRGMSSVREIQDSQLPIGPIETEQWEVAAIAHQGRDAGSEFYDWFMHDDGSLTVALASVHAAELGAAMTLQLLRGATKAAMLQADAPQRLVRRVADVAWTSTTGECPGSLAAVKLPTAGDIEFCSAGPLGAMLVRSARPTAISQGAPPLASDPDASYRGATHAVAVGEVVVLVSDAVRKATNADGEQLGEAGIADCVGENLHCDADTLANMLFDLWRGHTDDPRRAATILVAKRTGA